jgi:hypothetical protein
LVISLLCWHLISSPALRWGTALLIGFGLGLLGWLHVRFLPMAAVGLGWAMWTHRRERARLATVVLTFALLTSGQCLYAYHITGSILPSAMYDPAGGHDQFSWSAVPIGMLRQVFDRDYGVLPLAPMFLLALPGMGVMLRHNRRTLLLVIAFGLALFIPSGGHGVEIAGTTPGRFVLAVMPLGALPVVEWLRATRRRPMLVAINVLLIAVSLRNCAAHNLQNAKESLTMMDAGFSGWNPSMLFPRIRHVSWISRAFDSTSLSAWCLISVLAIVWGALLVEDRAAVGSPRSVSQVLHAGRLTARCFLALAGLGLVAMAAGGPRRQPQFLPRPEPATRRAQESSMRAKCWIAVGVPPPATGSAAP